MTTPSHDYEGLCAVVTGSTSGIGEATACAFGAAGASVVVTGRRSSEGQRVVDKVDAAGGTAIFVAADVRSSDQIDSVVEAAITTFGRLDFAFNNAGIFDRMQDFHSYDDDAWDAIISVNQTAVFRCMKAELSAMLASPTRPVGGASIVNCASTVAHRGSDRASPAYVASKHAVIGLTRQAAIQYANDGIRVNAVSPGPTLTEVAAPLIAEGPDAVRSTLRGLNPREVFVDAKDVADAVLYLCSPSASMINGQDIALDGGQLAML
ncbi:MAG: SDR family NAD(P)-dependent oxidoreductase [Acidimicrobiales bacterium]